MPQLQKGTVNPLKLYILVTAIEHMNLAVEHKSRDTLGCCLYIKNMITLKWMVHSSVAFPCHGIRHVNIV